MPQSARDWSEWNQRPLAADEALSPAEHYAEIIDKEWLAAQKELARARQVLIDLIQEAESQEDFKE